MGIEWSYSFTAWDTPGNLGSRGWTFVQTPAILSESSYIYAPSYDQMPPNSRRSLGVATVSGNNERYFRALLPISGPGAGWVAIAHAGGAAGAGSGADKWSSSRGIIRIQAGAKSIILKPNGSATSRQLSLFVNNVFKATSAASVVFNDMKYVAVAFDVTTTTWRAKAYLNGSELIPEQTATGAAASSSSMLGMATCQAFQSGGDAGISQVIVWDRYSDPGHMQIYVSKLKPRIARRRGRAIRKTGKSMQGSYLTGIDEES